MVGPLLLGEQALFASRWGGGENPTVILTYTCTTFDLDLETFRIQCLLIIKRNGVTIKHDFPLNSHKNSPANLTYDL